MEKSKRPTILITNDDSIHSKGIAELIRIAAQQGDVIVVAPDKVRSGMSSAITHTAPLDLQYVREEEGVRYYTCSGTPVDCVKLSFFSIFKDRRPDLVLSGINHGSNSSVNSVYSGTVGAAMEGCINHVSSIAFSLCDHASDADFSHTLVYIERIIQQVLNHSLPKGTFLNVNFPVGALQGVKVGRQADARWSEEYEVLTQTQQRTEFQLAGCFVNREPDSVDTDEWALDHHYGSIVPVKVDMTDYDCLTNIKTIYESI